MELRFSILWLRWISNVEWKTALTGENRENACWGMSQCRPYSPSHFSASFLTRTQHSSPPHPRRSTTWPHLCSAALHHVGADKPVVMKMNVPTYLLGGQDARNKFSLALARPVGCENSSGGLYSKVAVSQPGLKQLSRSLSLSFSSCFSFCLCLPLQTPPFHTVVSFICLCQLCFNVALSVSVTSPSANQGGKGEWFRLQIHSFALIIYLQVFCGFSFW